MIKVRGGNPLVPGPAAVGKPGTCRVCRGSGEERICPKCGKPRKPPVKTFEHRMLHPGMDLKHVRKEA